MGVLVRSIVYLSWKLDPMNTPWNEVEEPESLDSRCIYRVKVGHVGAEGEADVREARATHRVGVRMTVLNSIHIDELNLPARHQTANNIS